MLFRRSLPSICNKYFGLTVEIKNYACAFYSTGSDFVELPKKLKRSERKPWVTDINELKRRSRLERREKMLAQEATLKPPENGLLVKELIPVARDVMAARARLLSCVSRVSCSIPIFACSVCGDVHVGNPPHKIRTCNADGKIKEHTWERGGAHQVFPNVESFHLYDRLGRAVSHNERLQVDRIPAIVELCIQAGVDILEYPTRRRDFPVYKVAGKMLDFEKRFPKNDSPRKDVREFAFWEMAKRSTESHRAFDSPYDDDDLKGHAQLGMEALEKTRVGVNRLMQKYAVQTCGFCCEVQVGPKGHRVRQCQAFKHQMRDGQHAWQEATFEDLVHPVYVWHVADKNNPLLVHDLKRYYGMLPALVELFARAGAEIGENYRGLMREDVVVPTLEEAKFVV